MKKYWVIAYDQYYPSGGLGNVKATFETMEEAEVYLEQIERNYDYAYIDDVSRLLT